MPAFSLNIGEWCKKAKLDVDRAARAITLTIFSGVIEKTPVDTGAARGNWQISYDNYAKGVVSNRDTSRGSAEGAIAPQLKESLIGRTVYMVNNLPYIGVLEYGGYPNMPKSGEGKTIGGFSRQAPNGMVRVTLTEVSARVQQGIAKGMARG